MEWLTTLKAEPAQPASSGTIQQPSSCENLMLRCVYAWLTRLLENNSVRTGAACFSHHCSSWTAARKKWWQDVISHSDLFRDIICKTGCQILSKSVESSAAVNYLFKYCLYCAPITGLLISIKSLCCNFGAFSSLSGIFLLIAEVITVLFLCGW